jgi:hypothetical protein
MIGKVEQLPAGSSVAEDNVPVRAGRNDHLRIRGKGNARDITIAGAEAAYTRQALELPETTDAPCPDWAGAVRIEVQ